MTWIYLVNQMPNGVNLRFASSVLPPVRAFHPNMQAVGLHDALDTAAANQGHRLLPTDRLRFWPHRLLRGARRGSNETDKCGHSNYRQYERYRHCHLTLLLSLKIVGILETAMKS